MAGSGRSWNEILPFADSLRDIRRNFWHLRTYFLLIFLLLVLSSALFFRAENTYFVTFKTKPEQIKELVFITVDDVLPVSISSYTPQTTLGKAMSCVNALCGFVILGFFLWIIQCGLQEHKLRKSKFIFFSTKEEA